MHISILFFSMYVCNVLNISWSFTASYIFNNFFVCSVPKFCIFCKVISTKVILRNTLEIADKSDKSQTNSAFLIFVRKWLVVCTLLLLRLLWYFVVDVTPCYGQQLPVVDSATGLEFNCGIYGVECPRSSFCHQSANFAKCCPKGRNVQRRLEILFLILVLCDT